MTSQSKGVIIFAYNSGFDYVKIANLAAALAKKHLKLPITIVTDEAGVDLVDTSIVQNILVTADGKGHRRSFKIDNKIINMEWKNFSRSDVYNLSPYEETLMIDCDYLIFNDSLLKLFGTDEDFLCHDSVLDLTGKDTFSNDKRIAQFSLPMLWATVVYFRKSETAEGIFEMMKMVKDNYDFYSAMYGFHKAPYRNDFALSIAYATINGYNTRNNKFIPWDLATLSTDTRLISITADGQTVYTYTSSNSGVFVGNMSNMNLHIMNKSDIEEHLDTIMNYAKSV